MPIKTAGIIGLGLLGGSLAKSLKNRAGLSIVGFDKDKNSVNAAFNDGVIDIAAKHLSDFSQCDVTFVCAPLDYIPDIIKKTAPFLKRGAIITDVGSVKNEIMERTPSFDGVTFIGGHPMAGSELTGYFASKEYLFENACYALCPAPDTDEKHIDTLKNLVLKIGAAPLVMDPKLHDAAVAAVSHAPHIIASALVNSVKKLADSNGDIPALVAGGFKDITRIASSNPELWGMIANINRSEILTALTVFKNEIESFEAALRANDAEKLFSEAKLFRDGIPDRAMSTYGGYYVIFVDILDTPGIIGKISTVLGENGINIKNIGIGNSRAYEGGALQIAFEYVEHRDKTVRILGELGYTTYL
jgi:prephenate dehydrogenase